MRFVCSETIELGEELVGSYLYKVHLHNWLESTKMPPPVGQRYIYKGKVTSLFIESVRLRTWTEFLRSTGVELIDQLDSTIRWQLHSEEWHFDISSSLYRADKSDGSFRCSC